ncbi:hypothetical protein [Paracoccus tegillarcae]|uniref:DUF4352 domain-containing protein n=1 Tax=Paracoccus tegillarcae TaxID=1529068 RepID=A0A2K9EWH9_9RHOB|nr:hypothetical protein [Paracoccus tegillarcae]AUH33634.1 hypothetical protein CUV01_09755 [Paracoccus tegillarcae]
MSTTMTLRAIALGLMIPAGLSVQYAHAQEAEQTAADQPADGQIYGSGRHEKGEVVADVDGLSVDGERLTVKMTLRPTNAGQKVGSATIYAGMSNSNYEQIYLVSGDKKYMLVRDSQDTPLAPPRLTASGSGETLGIWYGVFPNPPAGQDITLYMPALEPIGPFTVPAQ